MPLRKTEKASFIYFVYKRGTVDDVAQLKTELHGEARDKSRLRDIVVDLTACDLLTNCEIGVLAGVARIFNGTPRVLRVVSGPGIVRNIESIGLPKTGCVVTYQSHELFFRDMGSGRVLHSAEPARESPGDKAGNAVALHVAA